jgi:hypothetical protein
MITEFKLPSLPLQFEFKLYQTCILSKHCRYLLRVCRYTVAATVTPGVLQPSPLQEISSWDYGGRGVLRKQRTVIEPLLWSLWQEGWLDHFLNSGVGIMPNNDENLLMETSFSVGSILTPLLSKKDEGSIQSHLRNQNDKDLWWPRHQEVHLVRVSDAPDVLSHNEWTSDEHGNACVQWGLTSC